MPPRINGCPVSLVISKRKVVEAETETFDLLQSSLIKVSQLEQSQQQLMQLNTAMVELLTDIVGKVSSSRSGKMSSIFAPGSQWKSSSSHSSSSESCKSSLPALATITAATTPFT